MESRGHPVALAETPDQQKCTSPIREPRHRWFSNQHQHHRQKRKSAPGEFGWVSPVWVVARSDRNRAYVLDQGSGLVSAIDSSCDSVVSSVSVGVGANFMIYDPSLNRIYVSTQLPIP